MIVDAGSTQEYVKLKGSKVRLTMVFSIPFGKCHGQNLSNVFGCVGMYIDVKVYVHME